MTDKKFSVGDTVRFKEFKNRKFFVSILIVGNRVKVVDSEMELRNGLSGQTFPINIKRLLTSKKLLTEKI